MAEYTFFSAEWAAAVREQINQGPEQEYKGVKLQTYWDWVDQAGRSFQGRLALGVRDWPGAAREPYLLLTLAAGVCTEARLVDRTEAEQTATFVLRGRYADWQSLFSGYDMGRAVMYRKLALESGEVLHFFNRIFYFLETLACMARVPTRFPGTAA